MFIQAGTHIHKHSSQSVLFVSPAPAPYTCILCCPRWRHESIKYVQISCSLCCSPSLHSTKPLTNSGPSVHTRELCRGSGSTCWDTDPPSRVSYPNPNPDDIILLLQGAWPKILFHWRKSKKPRSLSLFSNTCSTSSTTSDAKIIAKRPSGILTQP